MMTNNLDVDLRRSWIIAVLLLITPLGNLLPYLAMSVLMDDIMVGMDVSMSLAGLAMIVTLAISGVCMFIGSKFHDFIGIRNTIRLAIFMMTIGSAVCFLAGNFTIFFIGRIISGVGFGLNSVSSMFIIGSLVGGICVARLKRRKIMFQAGIVLIIVGGLLFSFAQTQISVIISVSLIGFGFMSRMPSQSLITMETLKPPNPAILGGAQALIGGVGQMATLGVAPLFSFLTNAIGMAGAFRIVFGALIVSAIANVFVNETGQNS